MPDISINNQIIEVVPTFQNIEVMPTIQNIEVMTFGNNIFNISGSGNIEVLETLENVATYKLLASVNGKMELADKDNPAHAFNIVGISTSSGSEGSTIFVQTGGTILNGAWSWIQGVPLWLGKEGNITQTPPDTGFLIQIGIALSPTKILLEIQEASEL